MKTISNSFFCLFICVALVNSAYAKKTSFGYSKTTSKPAYEGFGKPSKINGRIKTKTTHGYFKPSKGYRFVNPYSRSK